MGFRALTQVVSGVVRHDPANSKPEFAMDPVARFVPENTLGYKYVGEAGDGARRGQKTR